MGQDIKRDPEVTRNSILDAAEELFLENGFGRTAMSAIGRRAGITKSLIHHHFGSKKDLWQEVKKRMLNVYFVGQKEMLHTQSGDVGLLRDSIIAYFKTLQANPSFIRLLTWIFLEKDTQCYDLGEEITEMGIAKIRNAQQEGRIRSDIHAPHILFSFLALCEHWFLAKDQLLGNRICKIAPDHAPENEDDAFLEDLLKIFFRGILVSEFPEE